jgi:hypothetical protein
VIQQQQQQQQQRQRQQRQQATRDWIDIAIGDRQTDTLIVVRLLACLFVRLLADQQLRRRNRHERAGRIGIGIGVGITTTAATA